jgi:hypothetical protein
MNNRLLNAFMQGMTGGSPMPQQGYPRQQQPPVPPAQPLDPPGGLQFPQNPYEIGGGLMRLPNGVMVPARQALGNPTFGGELVAQMMRSQGNTAGPSGAMPTPVGMNRPTFSSWLDRQRRGDMRSTIQQRIGDMRNRAGNNGQISGDATGMGSNAVRGDLTGMGDNATMNEARRRAAQQRAAERGGR